MLQIQGLNSTGGDDIKLVSLLKETLKYFVESWDRESNEIKVKTYSFMLRSVPDMKLGFRLTQWGYVMYELLIKTIG